MTIKFVDPRAQLGVVEEPYELSVELTGDQTIGLLANGFPDSVQFLDFVEQGIHERLPMLKINRYNKGDATSIAGDQILSSIAEECRAVITAYGH